MSGRPLRWPFLAAVTGLVLAALGTVVIGWWQFYGVGPRAADRAEMSSRAFLADCGSTPPLPGGLIGTLTLPGAATQWPVRAGVDDAALAGGVGWYTQTAGPGQLGNMAVVGYRSGWGEAFDALLTLPVGDKVTLVTCREIFTYTIRVAPRDLTVQSGDKWILDAVPGQPSAMPTSAWLTLISSLEWRASGARAVGFAELTETAPR